MTIYIVTLTYPLASNPLSHLRDQQATWGQRSKSQSRQGTPSVTAAMSSSSSSFWQHVFFTYFQTSNFDHYYALRIFHVYKCTVNENTNKSAYWYTSHKSSIPGFGKPGIVAEICPSGFVHASYLPSDWLTLVWTHPLSQIENNTFFPNHDNWVVPFTCCGSQCCLAPKCFLLKIKHFGWFP